SLLQSPQREYAPTARTGLSAHVYQGIGPISKSEWNSLFPTHPDPYELVQLTVKSGMDGFEFHSLVIRLNGEPVLIMPIFETEFPLTLVLDGRAKEVAVALESWLKPL